jgi:hypothetical protein
MVRRRWPHWHLLLGTLAVVIVVSGGFYLGHRLDLPGPVVDSPARPAPSRNAEQFTRRMQAASDSLLGELGIPGHLIEMDADAVPLHVRVGVPRDLPLAMVNLHLTRAVQRSGGRVLSGMQPHQSTVELTCGFHTDATLRYTLRRARTVTRRTGRIALVIRDVARPDGPLQGMWAVAQQLTLLLGEPLQTPWVVPGDEANAGTHELFSDQPGAGPPPMEPALRDLVRASALILDLQAETEAIERQLWALADRAADEGHAIGVTGDHPAARDALLAVLPRLERRGYRFVAASSLLP